MRLVYLFRFSTRNISIDSGSIEEGFLIDQTALMFFLSIEQYLKNPFRMDQFRIAKNNFCARFGSNLQAGPATEVLPEIIYPGIRFDKANFLGSSYFDYPDRF